MLNNAGNVNILLEMELIEGFLRLKDAKLQPDNFNISNIKPMFKNLVVEELRRMTIFKACFPNLKVILNTFIDTTNFLSRNI